MRIVKRGMIKRPRTSTPNMPLMCSTSATISFSTANWGSDSCSTSYALRTARCGTLKSSPKVSISISSSEGSEPEATYRGSSERVSRVAHHQRKPQGVCWGTHRLLVRSTCPRPRHHSNLRRRQSIRSLKTWSVWLKGFVAVRSVGEQGPVKTTESIRVLTRSCSATYTRGNKTPIVGMPLVRVMVM